MPVSIYWHLLHHWLKNRTGFWSRGLYFEVLLVHWLVIIHWQKIYLKQEFFKMIRVRPATSKRNPLNVFCDSPAYGRLVSLLSHTRTHVVQYFQKTHQISSRFTSILDVWVLYEIPSAVCQFPPSLTRLGARLWLFQELHDSSYVLLWDDICAGRPWELASTSSSSNLFRRL